MKTSISSTLSNSGQDHTVTPRRVQSAISDLRSSLQKEWPTLACPSGNGIQFWSHEWEKHGTCSESVLQQHDYFEAALTLKQKSNLLQALNSAGIEANRGSYSLNNIKGAIKEATGVP
ncbi:hypothetical protein K1719_033618 [Acacia pycnantha]|nr:hypothetical protein K1719_033618 [Acacia pycnantha]